MTTDEQKIKAIRQCMIDLEIYDGSHDCCSEILESLKQFDPEPLEVEIEHREAEYEWHHDGYLIHIPNNWFNKEQDAVDFAERWGLRVKK